MANTYRSYELSQEADRDMEDVFDYTVYKFGIDQAIAYVSSFDDVFDDLAKNPELGRARNEIRAELRSFVKGSHVIFYRIFKTNIRIVRVLHTSREVKNFIPPAE